jgi:signal transduction histidine kinase
VIDRSFRIVEANRSFKKNYGEWKELPCYTVYKGRSDRCERCAAAETFTDGQTRVREELGKVLNGRQTYYLVHMVPLIEAGGEIPYIIEMSTDITATKTLEQEKLEAERLAAVGQTVAGLAHGVKNLLMGLEGGIYVFKSGMERGDEKRMINGWQMLEENIERISSFVKEFLEFARGSTPAVQLVSPARLAQQVIELFKDKAALAGIELNGHLEDNIPYALMDEDAIHSCLVNLVSNALDACEISDRPSRHVVVSVREQNGSLIFEVADDGVGMDYEIKKRVFTNFFSTKGSGKGTGLGLLTTRKIVQEHGGKVSFESEEGKGSTFRLEFPRDRLPRPAEKVLANSR